jgi:hypothetical protein
MCEDCEQAEPLRDVYLARRARMVATWPPRRRWNGDPTMPAAAVVAPQPDAEPNLIASQ